VLNVERDARATFVVHDSRPGFEVCGAAITGRVAVVRGEPAAILVERVHRRYVVADAEEDDAVRTFLSSDDVALRLRPESAWTWDERRSDANEALRALGGALPLLSNEPRG
jgi:hypothetical protein